MCTPPSASTSTRSNDPRSAIPFSPTGIATSKVCSLATNVRSGRVVCQVRNRRTASPAATRSARDCHTASKPSSAHTASMCSSSATGSAGSCSRATPSASTWMIEPKPSAVVRATSALASCPRNHLSGQRVISLSWLPENASGSPAGRTGTGDDVGSSSPHQRAGSADGDERVPVVGGGAGEHGEAPGRRGAQLGRARRVDGDAAQLRDEPGHRQRPLRAAGRGGRRGRARGRGRRRGSARAARPSSSADRTAVTTQALLGARAGDVEQPALLGEQHRGRRGVDQAAGLEPVGLQQRAAPADVRPHALLHRRHDDQAPLQALGPVRGEQAHGRAAHTLLREGVGRDLLLAQLGEEVGDAAAAGVALLDALGGGEQREHRVEVGIGTAARVAAAQRRRLEPLRPARAAARGRARPDRPQHRLGAALRLDHGSRVVQQAGQAAYGGERVPGARVAARRRGGDRQHGLGVGGQELDELADQRGRRRGPALGILLALDAAQRAAEAAQVGGVGVGERGEQQLARGLVVERAGVDDDAEQREQRRDRGLLVQRQLVGRDLDRHAGGGERTAQRGHGPAAAAHEHRHLVPRHALLEVGAAQRVGDVAGLRRLGVEGAHLDRAVAVRRPLAHRRAVQPLDLGGQRGQRRGAQHARGGVADHRAEAAGGAQHDGGSRAALGARERVAEAEDAARVGAAERVDRLVGVADDDERRLRADEAAQQPHLRGVGVLELVDVHGAEPVAQAGLHHGVVRRAAQRGGRSRCSR